MNEGMSESVTCCEGHYSAGILGSPGPPKSTEGPEQALIAGKWKPGGWGPQQQLLVAAKWAHAEADLGTRSQTRVWGVEHFYVLNTTT